MSFSNKRHYQYTNFDFKFFCFGLLLLCFVLSFFRLLLLNKFLKCLTGHVSKTHLQYAPSFYWCFGFTNEISVFKFKCWFLGVKLRNTISITHFIYERKFCDAYCFCLRFSYEFQRNSNILSKINLCAKVSICTEFFQHLKLVVCTL